MAAMQGGSTSYAPIAARYEEVRGGARRADELVAAIEPWLTDGVVCDVGAGTGVVTERFAGAHRRVVSATRGLSFARRTACSAHAAGSSW